jgi:hypothetical protein
MQMVQRQWDNKRRELEALEVELVQLVQMKSFSLLNACF